MRFDLNYEEEAALPDGTVVQLRLVGPQDKQTEVDEGETLSIEIPLRDAPQTGESPMRRLLALAARGRVVLKALC